MPFNSFAYLLFLPAVFLLYWLPAGKGKIWQNWLLLVASYVFYCAWDWRFSALIAFTTLTSFLSGLFLEKTDRRGRKAVLAANIAVNLLILLYFKYAGFFVGSFRSLLALFGIDMPGAALDIILPVGISFYTFQAIGYTVDVYRGDVRASSDFVEFAAFISFFPQLVAGPIERASSLLPQFSARRSFDRSKAEEGLALIIFGLFLKIVVADRLGVLVDNVYGSGAEISGAAAVTAVVFFAFQLYVDFFSYTRIAQGSAKLFGMELVRNFNHPYLSKSFKEFWKRWHISLSSWFTDYVYIPLGGNRKGRLRKMVNVFIVFLLSGLWHGAAWTFAVWGLICAAAVACLDGMLKKSAGKPVLNCLVIFTVWSLSLIFFRAADFGQAVTMFSSLGLDGWSDVAGAYGLGGSELALSWYLIAGLVVWEVICEKWSGSLKAGFHRCGMPVKAALAFALIAVILLLGHYGIANDTRFIYFQF